MAPAAAQFMRDHEKEGGVRGFHGARSIGGIKRSFQSDGEARAEFERIASAIGFSWITDRITLRASAETPNAEASIGKNAERFIFYNADFMQKVKQKTAEHWSLMSILAHELGHHLAFHTEIEGRYHEFELEADYFSGFVLKRLGATLEQAQTAMRLLSPKEPGPIHPGLDDRLQAITLGWTDGGMTGAPPGLKGKQPPPPEAKAPPQTQLSEAERVWGEIKGATDVAVLEAFRTRYKDAFQSELARARIDELKQAQSAKKKADEEALGKAEAQRLALLQEQAEKRKRAEAEAAKKKTEEAARRDPALAAPSQTPAFGTPNVVFVVGVWRIVRSSGEFYLWAENGDRAIQVTLDSNGWWGLRRQSDEKIVWSSGRTGEGPFYERPWLRGAGATFQISTGYYEGTGTQGITVIRVANDQILITLTDRGEIQLNIRARTIIFRTGRGETLTF